MPDTALLIAGPTASGKSKIAMDLAARLRGVIINADSMQLYKDLAILSARPSDIDEARAPHRLYGFVDAGTASSAALWHQALRETLDEVRGLSLFPIITGGTGLYFKAALEGLAEIPSISDEIRDEIRAQLKSHGAEALHALLDQEDPLMAERLAPGDGQRIARALEVVRSTGRSLGSWQEEEGNGVLKVADKEGLVTKIILELPREELYARIDKRFDQMMDGDAIGEVSALLDRELDPGLPAMRALGVPQLATHVRGEIALEEAVEKAKTESRRFAKRQLTWFGNQFPDWLRIDSRQGDAAEKIFKIVQKA